MIRIRSYKADDHDAVLDIFSAGLLEYAEQPGQVKLQWEDHIAACIHDDLADIPGVYFGSGGHFWVAIHDVNEQEEVVVGLVGLEKKADDSFELRRLSIHRDYRRQGVARQLVAHLEQWAKAHAATSVWLCSGSPMTLAHAFYKSIGYTHFKTQVLPTVEMLFFEKAV